MREIKFRAWLKLHREMITESDFYDATMVSNGNGFGIVIDQNWLKKEDFEIMQFTGLKDKNGVEIYEGDILENKKSAKSNFFVKFNCGVMMQFIKTTLHYAYILY